MRFFKCDNCSRVFDGDPPTTGYLALLNNNWKPIVLPKTAADLCEGCVTQLKSSSVDVHFKVRARDKEPVSLVEPTSKHVRRGRRTT